MARHSYALPAAVKICRRCGVEKPINGFYEGRRVCPKCLREQQLERNGRNGHPTQREVKRARISASRKRTAEIKTDRSVESDAEECSRTFYLISNGASYVPCCENCQLPLVLESKTLANEQYRCRGCWRSVWIPEDFWKWLLSTVRKGANTDEVLKRYTHEQPRSTRQAA